jgi:KUP system potassium uptake protein
VLAVRIWRWSVALAAAVVGSFLIFDLGFLAGTIPKILDGGWVPLLLGTAAFTLMTTWMRGRRRLAQLMSERSVPASEFFEHLDWVTCARVPGTAVFLTPQKDGIPIVLQHHVRHNRVLRAQTVLLTVETLEVPTVAPRERIKLDELGGGVFRVIAQFGFMEEPNVPAVLEACAILGLAVEISDIVYYVGRETLLIDGERGGKGALATWRKRLFGLVSRNAASAVSYFHIPPEQVVELGLQVRL